LESAWAWANEFAFVDLMGEGYCSRSMEWLVYNVLSFQFCTFRSSGESDAVFGSWNRLQRDGGLRVRVSSTTASKILEPMRYKNFNFDSRYLLTFEESRIGGAIWSARDHKHTIFRKIIGHYNNFMSMNHRVSLL
jgi:hypothetical protein